ncbi:MAG: 5-formyltetrahydrofolate cyclo-ligase [Oscillospiraceae bacterium]|nr:5-formyltetrahydrofolate cyclo-ligase [Oscillospiraceae bacterium]
MDKRTLRARIAEQVHALDSAYCADADAAICAAVWESELYKNAVTMFCYIGTDREIDTRALLERALADGKRLALPLCVGKGIMEARAIQSLDDLVAGKFNIPAPHADCPVVAPEAFDLVIVPCSTGNAKGQRLGYGGGFYDRYLGKTQCPKVLLCREKLVTEDIPVEEHDLVMDYLTTENGLTKCGE